jgi:hypothetical protein
MRKSRVLLAGVAVAAAGVATSAFTAGNTFDQTTSVVGYGEVAVTGIHVTTVTYNRLASDKGVLDTVVFASDEAADISTLMATMTLKDTVAPNAGTVTNHNCDAPAGGTGAWTITCHGDGVVFSDFDAVGLTVGGA